LTLKCALNGKGEGCEEKTEVLLKMKGKLSKSSEAFVGGFLRFVFKSNEMNFSSLETLRGIESV
jgi:hypothetical protein